MCDSTAAPANVNMNLNPIACFAASNLREILVRGSPEGSNQATFLPDIVLTFPRFQFAQSGGVLKPLDNGRLRCWGSHTGEEEQIFRR